MKATHNQHISEKTLRNRLVLVRKRVAKKQRFVNNFTGVVDDRKIDRWLLSIGRDVKELNVLNAWICIAQNHNGVFIYKDNPNKQKKNNGK